MRLVFLLFLGLIASRSFAQEDSSSSKWSNYKSVMDIGSSMGYSSRNNIKVYTHAVSFAPGVQLGKRLFVTMPMTLEIGNFSTDSTSSIASAGTLGLSANYRVLNTVKNFVDLGVEAGLSTFSDQWSYYYSDYSVRVPLSLPKSHWNSFARFGLRQYFSRNNHFDNHNIPYVAIGITLK